MDLNKIFKLSPFLKRYEYLNQNYDIQNIDSDVVLSHLNYNIDKYFSDNESNDLKIEDLKNELIYLLFFLLHSNKKSQDYISRLWSLICKQILLRIFNSYLSSNFNNFKKNYFILGMGKIGVKDLNFTSDIDLIIFFDSKNSPISLFEFNKVIKKLISDISNVSNTFFHKIDLRLRPDLGNSYLITDLDSAIDYYSSVGRNWERLAFHRSQFIGGSIEKYNFFISSIKSFLYRRSFDYYAIDEIKKLFLIKDQSKSLDIKNSYGYIRSCENIIHFNQLLWSGKFPPIRENNIHRLFSILANYNFLSEYELKIVKDAYYFYRKVENYLHIKLNVFQNIVEKNDSFLEQAHPNYYQDLQDISEKIRTIFEKLFESKVFEKKLNLDSFNDKSKTIIKNLYERANNINSSESVKNEYTQSINHLISILETNQNKDELIVKFDYLITYFKSGIHLSSLYKYNQHLYKEIIFIFDNSPKLTNFLQKNNFLIESLVYFFNYGPPDFKIRQSTDNFDLDLKKIIQDIYETIFILDYLYLSNKIPNDIYLIKRNRNLIKFIFNLFEFVRENYLINKKGIFSDLTPILFGSLALNQALPSSDADIFFVYKDSRNDHIHSIKIVRRFYSIFKQYIDKNFLYTDDRNKPFDKNSDQVININHFFDFYKNTQEIFHLLSFTKIKLISKNKIFLNKFYSYKKNIIRNFPKIDKEYIFKMIDIKKPCEDLKDLFQIYKISYEIFKFNGEKFIYEKRIKDLRKEIIEEDIKSNSSNIVKKQYLDELLKIID